MESTKIGSVKSC